MALVYPTPSDIANEYLTTLKTFKPEVDISRKDSDWWIRAQVVGGVHSGIYGDQSLLADDPFPQSARHDALNKHLQTYFGRDFNPPQPALGTVAVSGVNGTLIPAHTELIYLPNGNTYTTILDVTLAGPTGTVDILSDASGQGQNLIDGAALSFPSPPGGLNPNATALGPIGGGRNGESDSEAAAVVLEFIQQPPAGGTAADYKRFAQEASASVVDASVIRYYFGFGTLAIIITAGTTDIDGALNNNIPVVREPPAPLVAQVQAAVQVQAVETDCVTVFGPSPVSQDVTVKVRFKTGNQFSFVQSLGLSQGDLVRREVKRAIYKTPPGGRQFAGLGYLVASEIEQTIDVGLSAEPYETGVYASIVVDRDVEDLSLTGPNRLLLPIQIAEPGTISIVEF